MIVAFLLFFLSNIGVSDLSSIDQTLDKSLPYTLTIKN